jgi:hypothetical protein
MFTLLLLFKLHFFNENILVVLFSMTIYNYILIADHIKKAKEQTPSSPNLQSEHLWIKVPVLC